MERNGAQLQWHARIPAMLAKYYYYISVINFRGKEVKLVLL